MIDAYRSNHHSNLRPSPVNKNLTNARTLDFELFPIMCINAPLPFSITCFANGNLCTIFNTSSIIERSYFESQLWVSNKNVSSLPRHKYSIIDTEQKFNDLYAMIRVGKISRPSYVECIAEDNQTNHHENSDLIPFSKMEQVLFTNVTGKEVSIRVEITYDNNDRKNYSDMAKSYRLEEITPFSDLIKSEQVFVWRSKLCIGQELFVECRKK